MTDRGKQRPILFKDCLPIVPMKLRIVEILALDAPRLAKNLFPLGARIDAHFELRDAERAVAYSNGSRPICRNDSPSGPSAGAGLIEKFFLVIRKRVRTN